jgi:hypothetical protein
MTSFLFLLLAIAMGLAWRGDRRAGIAVFAVAALLSVAWFNHHLTDPLKLDFRCRGGPSISPSF